MKKIKTYYFKVAGAIIGSFLLSATTNAQQTSKLTDPQIASVAVVANQIDINAAKLAQSKSHTTEVLDFAKTMINDHQSVIDKATALVQKLKVSPQDNALSKQLQSGAAKTRKTIMAKSGKAFDRAYVDNEVTYHKAVIAVVENRLIPEASNTELKNLLQSVMPVLKAHLEHAQMVQKQLSGK